jgi:4-alpha-glucanotransferase
VILPVQDVFGWQARINQPATVSHSNWTWKLPWPSDRLLSEPEALEAADFLRQSAGRHGRYSGDRAGD